MFWSIFMEIHWKLLFTSESSSEILRKFIFSQQVRKVANPEENLDLFKQLFLIKAVKVDKCNKNCFSPQNEPQLNYAFVFFVAFLGKIYWKLLFLVKKVTISERSSEKRLKFVFSTSLKSGNPEEKLDYLNNFF